MKKIIVLAVMVVSLSGCIASAVSTAVDVGVEAVKVPFKVGGAIYDGVAGDDDHSDENTGESSDNDPHD